MEDDISCWGSQTEESVDSLLDSNLPSPCFLTLLQGQPADTEDGYPALLAAEKEARESGCLTPLIKQELKLLVQNRRLSQGKNELQVEFHQPASVQQLTPAEVERRDRRKEQNKHAARRFRRKKKLHKALLLETLQMLDSNNRSLHEQLLNLQRAKDHLLRRLTSYIVPSSPISIPSPLLTPPSPPPHFPGTAPRPAPPYRPVWTTPGGLEEDDKPRPSTDQPPSTAPAAVSACPLPCHPARWTASVIARYYKY